MFEDLDSLVRIVESDPVVYLRFSEGPEQDLENGPSQDMEAGVQMPGWAVTPLRPEHWWTRSTRDWVARRVCKYLEMGSEPGRYPWVLTGEVVGEGPDHEPLVDDFTMVGRLSERAVDEAREHYHAAFQVGRAQ